jgi:RND superfamily putative drug exporter
MLVVEGEQAGRRRLQLAALQEGIDNVRGVRAVIGPVDRKLQQRYGLLISPDGSSARFIVVLNADPNGAGAIAILDRLRERLPTLLARSGMAGVRMGVAGDTAIAAELRDNTRQAFIRVGPAAVLVLFLLLWALLRSWTAPLYLVGVSALVVAAALGITVYVFQGLAGYGEVVFFVPIAGAILLLALGSDYNVFLISRIWQEADRRKLQPAIRTAGARAGRAITVAGMILALSFATVALVPILAFRELAFMMAVGLILDTVVARTFLIPALVSLFGRHAKSKESGALTPQEG